MENFIFYNPVKIVFGAGESKQTGLEAAKLGKNALVVSYKQHEFFEELLKDITSQLEEIGVKANVFYEVTANPTIDQVRQGVTVAKSEGVDVIIAVGGGSAMDAAKLIAAGVLYPSDPWDMIVTRHDNVTAVAPTEALPMVMVPTLPATASEMNPGAVVTNPETEEKSYVFAECLFPKVSILDPALTTTLPAYQTACGAADAISHALESYLNAPADTPLQDGMLESVIRTTVDNAKVALAEPSNISARSNLQWSASLAWNGWCNAGVNSWAPMHQLGHPMSAKFNLAHGASLAVVMPSWMRYILPNRLERLVKFATNAMNVNPAGKTEEQIANEGIDTFEKFLKEIGVPTTLSAANIPADAIDSLVEDVRKISLNDEGTLIGRPAVDIEGVREIYNLAL